jgi:hypothetical protein
MDYVFFLLGMEDAPIVPVLGSEVTDRGIARGETAMRRAAWLMAFVAAAYSFALPGTASAIGGRWRCGGCSDTCFTSYAPPVPAGCAAPAPICLDTGPVKEMHVVLVPTYVTEKQSVCATEYREEQRQRVVCGYKAVNVVEERVRVITVPVSKVETKIVEYTVQAAVQGEQQRTYKIKVPVWTEQPESYNVKVPVLKEIQEQYCVQVPVLKEVPFTYCVNVPYPVTNIVNRTVSTVVPVVKTRTLSYCVPVTKTKSVPVDRGHWENRVEQVSGGPVQAPSKGAPIQVPSKGSEKQALMAGGGQMVCRQVWVPNVINEEISEVVPQQQTAEVQYLVYEQHYSTVPHECVCIEYRPENRTGVKMEVVYETQMRTRPRTIVEYVNETRVRPKKVLTFKEETRTETYPVITYQPEKRTKEVSYTVCVPESRTESYSVTRCEQVPDNRIENYTERICVPVVKEMEVQVCRMVPKVVSLNVCPCPGVSMPEGKPSAPQPAPKGAAQQAPLAAAAQPEAPKCCGG